MMTFAWLSYDDCRKFAWGKDVLLPLSSGGRNDWGGMACTMVDSLDTLWLMGLKEVGRGEKLMHMATVTCAPPSWQGGFLFVSFITLFTCALATQEFYEARDWIRDNLDISHVGVVSVFETNIR
jgi:hypothetical protein